MLKFFWNNSPSDSANTNGFTFKVILASKLTTVNTGADSPAWNKKKLVLKLNSRLKMAFTYKEAIERKYQSACTSQNLCQRQQ